MDSKLGIVTRKKDFKFYVAGTTTNLVLTRTTDYDIDGNILADAVTTITTLENQTDFQLKSFIQHIK